MDLRLVAKEDAAHLIALDILDHAFYAVFKHNDLAIHNVFHAIDRSNAVTDADYRANLFAFFAEIKINDLFFQY